MFASQGQRRTYSPTTPHPRAPVRTVHLQGEVPVGHASWACSHTGEDTRICQLHLGNPEPPREGWRGKGGGCLHGNGPILFLSPSGLPARDAAQKLPPERARTLPNPLSWLPGAPREKLQTLWPLRPFLTYLLLKPDFLLSQFRGLRCPAQGAGHRPAPTPLLAHSFSPLELTRVASPVCAPHLVSESLWP